MKRFVTAVIMLSIMASASLAADQIKVLIIDGVNNHDWEMTTEATKATLEQTGRFKVDVSTSPRKRASKEEWNAYRPKFSDYQVVIGNFNNDCEEEDGCDPLWSPKTMADFEKFVREGGGFVLIHGALQLDEIDDYVNTPFVLNPADGKFSVFVWVKGGAPGQVILSQESGVNWLTADAVDGALKTDLRTPEKKGRIPIPPGPPLISPTVVTDGDWHRVGFVRDGSDRILYVDDIEVARDTATNLESASGGLYIGAGSDLEPGAFWSGLIDDVRIYNRAVTP